MKDSWDQAQWKVLACTHSAAAMVIDGYGTVIVSMFLYDALHYRADILQSLPYLVQEECMDYRAVLYRDAT